MNRIRRAAVPLLLIVLAAPACTDDGDQQPKSQTSVTSTASPVPMRNSGYNASFTYGLRFTVFTSNPTSSDGSVECRLDVKDETWPAEVAPTRVAANAKVTLYVNVVPRRQLSVKVLDDIEPQCFVRPDS